MPQPQFILVADLLVDVENPRLVESSQGQRETLRALAQEQGSKLAVLAKDIVGYGLNPGDALYVIGLEGAQRYVVLEGNRRLSALRALENPDLFEGAVRPGTLATIRRLSRTYQSSPIENAWCVVFANREEANHWIQLRHTGEARGAGTVRWRSDAASRFRARTGGPLETEVQALDFLERRGDLARSERSKVPNTTLRRILETPVIRDKIGLTLEDRTLKAAGDEPAVVKALMWLVEGLVSGEITEPKVSSIQDRIRFADTIPSEIVVPKTDRQAIAVAALATTTRPRPAPPSTTPAKPRTVLIPRNCVLNVTDQRVRAIEIELRRLDLETYTNAVSVLFRVFVELSCDSYLARNPIDTVEERSVLNRKLSSITKDLQNRAKLTEKQATPVLLAAQKDSLLMPSVRVMHEYIHNLYLSPSAHDLRVAWDNLQTFMIAIWTP